MGWLFAAGAVSAQTQTPSLQGGTKAFVVLEPEAPAFKPPSPGGTKAFVVMEPDASAIKQNVPPPAPGSSKAFVVLEPEAPAFNPSTPPPPPGGMKAFVVVEPSTPAFKPSAPPPPPGGTKAFVVVEPSTPSIRPYTPPAPTGGTKAFVVVEPERPAIKAATFTAVPAALAPIAAQPQPGKSLPGAQYKLPTDMGGDIVIRTELPGVDLVFTRESEGQLFDTIRAENQARPGAQRVTFPDRGVVTREKYAARNFRQMVERIEPSFVMHRRLYFEAINADRYGWEIGNLQPGISFGQFLYDVAAMPYHWGTRPFQRWDSSAGKCLPGDNTPLMFYPEEFSLTGLAAEAGAIGLGFVAFP